MRGLIHTAQIYRRPTSGGRTALEDSPSATWKCRVDPLSASIMLRDDLAQSTHRAIGQPTPTLEKGWKLVVGTVTYLIVHVQSHDTPRVAPHHQEVYLTKGE